MSASSIRTRRYLYVLPVDAVTDEPLRVRYNLPLINEEFAETCRLLWRHAQVSLLDVAWTRTAYPSFIILEPDYLIDISSLAECFRSTGIILPIICWHVCNYRITPARCCWVTLLTFLDEWIHAEEAPDYLACMKKAFRSLFHRVAACADLHDREKETEFFADSSGILRISAVP